MAPVSEEMLSKLQERVTALENRRPLKFCVEEFKKINHSLFGNSHPAESISVRLLLLERKACRIERVCWAIFVAVLGLLGKWVYALLG